MSPFLGPINLILLEVEGKLGVVRVYVALPGTRDYRWLNLFLKKSIPINVAKPWMMFGFSQRLIPLTRVLLHHFRNEIPYDSPVRAVNRKSHFFSQYLLIHAVSIAAVKRRQASEHLIEKSP
jgi:hypothetical protein